MSEFTACATRITDAMSQLTKKVTKRAAETEELTASGKPSMARAKALRERTAKDMDDFVIAAEADVAIFGNSVSQSLDAYAKSAALASNFDGSKERLEQALVEIRVVLFAATQAREHMTTFRMSVASVPPMTSSLVRARNRVVAVLDKLDKEFAKAINLLGGLESMLASVR